MSRSPFFELARVLVRFHHIASIIVNADHSIIQRSGGIRCNEGFMRPVTGTLVRGTREMSLTLVPRRQSMVVLPVTQLRGFVATDDPVS